MDQSTQFLALIVAAAVGVFAAFGILRRQRKETEHLDRESPYAVSSEGMKRCSACGFGNLVTDRDCASCGKRLPG